jgi:hypothetical protein
MVSTMARKLGIAVLTGRTASDVARIELAVGDGFDVWRRFCSSEGLYIIAIARVEAAGRRDVRDAQHLDDAIRKIEEQEQRQRKDSEA